MASRVRWARQGQLKWGEGWLKTYGPTRTRIPDYEDHIKFANFDLEHNGLPVLREDEQGLTIDDSLTPERRSVLLQILSYHGFELA